jgi:hypothetical protein
MKTLENKIPQDIRKTAKKFSIVDYKKKYGEDIDNLAKGEIEKINFTTGLKDMMKIGEPALKIIGDYSTIWVHLGKDYFKQISKVLDNRTC